MLSLRRISPVRSVRFFSSTLLRAQDDASAETPKAAEQPQTKLDLRAGSWSAKSSDRPKSKNYSALSASAFQMQKEAAEASAAPEIDQSFIPRFEVGSTYDPFDFSLTKMRLNQTKRIQSASKFKDFKKDPLTYWKNPAFLSDFLTSNGKILPSYVTGYRKKTQKKLAKAIKRARSAGLLSPVHKSVETLPVEPNMPTEHFLKRK
ncbi:hypothetical protein TRVA0_038S01112 [Trichomonascus vanleenenianus]|uniref:mitochondrial 37S ribosomal protein bS18m RSM18 n=1 Tax=Trichomonascus vanleenenianus TaxID=2268995 RepID=UPI003ECB33D4